MAGDWIKMRIDLAEDPAVIGMAEALGLDEFAVVGRLHVLWGWADSQSRDGHARGVTEKWIDRKVQRDGFAAAMAAAGWLLLRDGGIEFPNFDRHNGETAKQRGLATNRKKKSREKVTQNVTHASRHERDETVTREEKRREEIEASVGSTSTSAEISQGADDSGARSESQLGAISDDDAKAAVTAAIALRKVGVRIQPQDPTLLALVTERFTSTELALAAAEKALKDAGWWNDPDMHPELHELLAGGATQPQMGLTTEQCTAIKAAATQVSIRYIASTLRGRRREADQNTGNNHGSTRRKSVGGGNGGRRSAVDQVQFEIDQRERAAGTVVAHGAG